MFRDDDSYLNIVYIILYCGWPVCVCLCVAISTHPRRFLININIWNRIKTFESLCIGTKTVWDIAEHSPYCIHARLVLVVFNNGGHDGFMIGTAIAHMNPVQFLYKRSGPISPLRQAPAPHNIVTRTYSARGFSFAFIQYNNRTSFLSSSPRAFMGHDAAVNYLIPFSPADGTVINGRRRRWHSKRYDLDGAERRRGRAKKSSKPVFRPRRWLMGCNRKLIMLLWSYYIIIYIPRAHII